MPPIQPASETATAQLPMKLCSPDDQSIYKRCCHPAGQCQKVEPLIRTDELDDCVRVQCSNENCNVGEFMHHVCFEQWELSILSSILKTNLFSANINGSRLWLWEERQRSSELWTTKGLDLFAKLCRCKCGKGQLRKDIDWPSGRKFARNGHDLSIDCDGDDEDKKKRRKRNRGNYRSSSAGAYTLSVLNSNACKLAAADLNSGKEQFFTDTCDNGFSLPTLTTLSIANCGYTNITSGKDRSVFGYTTFDANSNMNSSKESSTCARTGMYGNSLATRYHPDGSNDGSLGSHKYSPSPPEMTGTQHFIKSITNSSDEIVDLHSQVYFPNDDKTNLYQRFQDREQRMWEIQNYSDHIRITSGCNGIFSRRLDFSSFNALSQTQLNSYQIKIEDEGNHGNDETRLFILSSLAQHKRNRVNCILCDELLLVYDRYPLIDGTFFLSPKQYSTGCVKVKCDDRNLYLTCICMCCLEGTNQKVICRFCKTVWNGSNLVLGTMYTYDVFAAKPCCIQRFKCNSCSKPLHFPDHQNARYFSDYSRRVTCPYCAVVDTHYVKPLIYYFTQESAANYQGFP